MVHLWVRAESRANERRVAITPAGVAQLIDKGFHVTVEQSASRILPAHRYAEAGAAIAPEGAWTAAPDEAVILGLKELPEDGSPLRHRHIMFGHAYKGQSAGQRLLHRFTAGGGALYDLEYLVTPSGRRVAAFGYWAGYAGAAVTALAWAAQRSGGLCPPVTVWEDAAAMRASVRAALQDAAPSALIIGALGRVGSGARALCEQVGIAVTGWDMAETASGGPFPEILDHDIFLNCILAQEGCPVFVPHSALGAPRRLSAIGDIACDPDSAFNPVPVYDRATAWEAPVLRVADSPVLDVMAIDNLPSLLPLESSEDFAGQLLPHLAALDKIEAGVWGRARTQFDTHKPEGQA